MRISKSTLKLIAIGYAVKTLAIGLAWYMIPDLPQRLSNHVQTAWTQLALRD
jgi:hypothetical protein